MLHYDQTMTSPYFYTLVKFLLGDGKFSIFDSKITSLSHLLIGIASHRLVVHLGCLYIPKYLFLQPRCEFILHFH